MKKKTASLAAAERIRTGLDLDVVRLGQTGLGCTGLDWTGLWVRAAGGCRLLEQGLMLLLTVEAVLFYAANSCLTSSQI